MRQFIKSAGAIAVVCGLAAGLSTVAAHHSTTMFDHSKTATINGTVVELRWVNPHVTLSVNGVERQRGQVGDMIWNVGEVIAKASELWTLPRAT